MARCSVRSLSVARVADAVRLLERASVVQNVPADAMPPAATKAAASVCVTAPPTICPDDAMDPVADNAATRMRTNSRTLWIPPVALNAAVRLNVVQKVPAVAIDPEAVRSAVR